MLVRLCSASRMQTFVPGSADVLLAVSARFLDANGRPGLASVRLASPSVLGTWMQMFVLAL